MAKDSKAGALATQLEQAGDDADFSAGQILAAHKAALQDFVRGVTNRKSLEVITRLLASTISARRQVIAERDGLSSQRWPEYYANVSAN